MLDPAAWPRSDAKMVAEEVARLGLEREVYELESYGLTVVPAERTGAADLCSRALSRICEVIADRTGVTPDSELGSTHVDVFTPSLYHFLHEDPVFEQLLLHPTALALATTVVGQRCVLIGTEVFMKGPATRSSGNDLGMGAAGEGLQLGLHSDHIEFPEPFPRDAHLCNVTWLLSDYTKDDGALAFVPGSHRTCRQPFAGEAVEAAVAVEAPAGSLVVWHGNTWHGSYPRTRPGLRTGLAFALAREYVHTLEPIRRDATPEMLDRNPPRLACLLGEEVNQWGTEGPDYAKLRRRPRRFSTYT